MVHDYCPYKIVFSKTPKKICSFDSNYNITPLYNIDHYAKESNSKMHIKEHEH